MTAQPTKEEAVERLQKLLDEVRKLQELKHDSPEFHEWRRNAEEVVNRTFGENSNWAEDLRNNVTAMLSHIRELELDPTSGVDRLRGKIAKLSRIPRPDPKPQRPMADSKYRAAYRGGLVAAKSSLESMIKEIEKDRDEDEQQSSGTSDLHLQTPPGNKKVFVVHGRDESARKNVASFLRQLELEPIILHEQPNEGRTIIEKFERHADVGFVVVLLTPDDVGGPAGRDNDLKPRARQNVILELGFFLGKLGRKRVCPLVKGNVERPSDYDGVVYIEMDDAEGWKTELIRELKAAGFDVDANRAT